MGLFRFLGLGVGKMSTPPKKPAPRKATRGGTAEYDAWYDEQVRLGLEDIESGRVIPHEEFVASGQALLEKLKRKHAKAA